VPLERHGIPSKNIFNAEIAEEKQREKKSDSGFDLSAFSEVFTCDLCVEGFRSIVSG